MSNQFVPIRSSDIFPEFGKDRQGPLEKSDRKRDEKSLKGGAERGVFDFQRKRDVIVKKRPDLAAAYQRGSREHA